MKNSLLLVLAGVCSVTLAATAVDVDVSKLPPPAAKKGVTYAADIKPLFDASCTRCHGAERQKGGLRLDTLEAALKGGEDGKVIVSGNSAKSSLVIAVSQLDPETAMPPKRGGGPGGKGPGGPGGGGGKGPGGPGGGGAPGGPGGPGGGGGFGGKGPGGPGGGGMAKALTPEQVGLVRAWIDQGTK